MQRNHFRIKNLLGTVKTVSNYLLQTTNTYIKWSIRFVNIFKYNIKYACKRKCQCKYPKSVDVGVGVEVNKGVEV